MIRDTPREALLNLLKALFPDNEGLASWLSLHDDLRGILDLLPSVRVAREEYFIQAVAQLLGAELVNPEFFRWLRSLRPRKSLEIERVANRFLAEGAAQATGDVERDAGTILRSPTRGTVHWHAVIATRPHAECESWTTQLVRGVSLGRIEDWTGALQKFRAILVFVPENGGYPSSLLTKREGVRVLWRAPDGGVVEAGEPIARLEVDGPSNEPPASLRASEAREQQLRFEPPIDYSIWTRSFSSASYPGCFSLVTHRPVGDSSEVPVVAPCGGTFRPVAEGWPRGQHMEQGEPLGEVRSPDGRVLPVLAPGSGLCLGLKVADGEAVASGKRVSGILVKKQRINLEISPFLMDEPGWRELRSPIPGVFVPEAATMTHVGPKTPLGRIECGELIIGLCSRSYGDLMEFRVGDAGRLAVGGVVAHLLSDPSIVRSWIVGTFYRSPSPGAPPFVREGDRVRRGQVLCIVEAMKINNELVAEIDGYIREIFVADGAPVQFEQPLMRIVPA